MGLFEKKYCDICGEKIGLLGNRKLEDGNLCKECAKKLSPWFSDRRESTVEQIKEQLAYREANQARVAAFNVTKILDADTKVLLDEDQKQLIVTGDSHWKDDNPDVLDFSQITGCSTDIDEMKTEVMKENSDGTHESYDPPRYNTSYTFRVTVHVNSPYFDEMNFSVNGSSVSRSDGEYSEAQKKANDICDALNKLHDDARAEKVEANAPKQAVVCSHCGATVIPDANNCCEFCGSALS